MKTGIVVDGQGEPNALAKLFPKLCGVGQLLRPLYADLQPKAAPGQIARKAGSRVDMLRQRGAGRIVLLIDREDRADCPPGFADDIARALERQGRPNVAVVIKNRTLENWLIADPDALGRLTGRFRPTPAFKNHISPNKADGVRNAVSLLNRICQGQPYQKRQDPPRILGQLSVEAAAQNSRSFRRFLRVLRDTRYRGQSKRP